MKYAANARTKTLPELRAGINVVPLVVLTHPARPSGARTQDWFVKLYLAGFDPSAEKYTRVAPALVVSLYVNGVA
jgi:hypothetical protein